MPRPASLSNISMSVLRAELRRRERAGRTLLRKRARLAAKLRVLDKALEATGKRIDQLEGRRTRPKNEMPLVATLQKVLKGKTMRVNDTVEAVQKMGYRTSASNFRTIVNAALLKKGNGFKKVGRGQYTVA